MFSNRIRASYRCLALVLVLVFAAGCAPAEKKEEAAPTGPAKIVMTSWTYDLAKVKDNLKRYEEWTNQREDLVDTTVDLSDFGFAAYETALTTRFMGGARIHVLYGSDAWLSKWVKAGFIVPIEDLDPRFRQYMDDMEPYVLTSLVYDGKLYGLSYYADHMQFVYNAELLRKAGLTSPPTTWAELLTQARTLIDRGLATEPFFLALSQTSWLDETFYALVYSQGGRFFDDSGIPTFGQGKRGPVLEMLEWLAAAINTHGIVPRKCLEQSVVDIQEVFKGGGAAFVIVPSYMLAEFQNVAVSKVAGQAKLALMPGTQHGTAGFGRTVFLGRSVLDAPKAVQSAALNLVEFLGGKVEIGGVTDYHIPKRWTVENGLGFGYKSMRDDPDVRQALGKIGDLDMLWQQKSLAVTKEGMEYPWYAEWIAYFRAELQKALMQSKTPEQILIDAENRWLSLKAEFE